MANKTEKEQDNELMPFVEFFGTSKGIVATSFYMEFDDFLAVQDILYQIMLNPENINLIESRKNKDFRLSFKKTSGMLMMEYNGLIFEDLRKIVKSLEELITTYNSNDRLLLN